MPNSKPSTEQRSEIIVAIEDFSQKLFLSGFMMFIPTAAGCFLGTFLCCNSKYYEAADEVGLRSEGHYDASTVRSKLMGCGCMSGGGVGFVGSIYIVYEMGPFSQKSQTVQKKTEVLVEQRELETYTESTELTANNITQS